MNDAKNAEDLWPSLKSAIYDIYRKNNASLKFECLYQDVYTMVRNNHGERLYKEINEVIASYLTNEVRTQVLACLRNNFLSKLNDVWNDFQTSMVMIRDVFMYLDNIYVRINNLNNVYDVGLILFRDKIIKYENISFYLRSTLLRMITRERKGENEDRTGIKNACDMLVSLGIGSDSFYIEEFETPFLEQTNEFYTKESYRFLSAKDAMSYVRNARARMEEESTRAKLCFGETTEKKVMKILEEQLLRKHIKIIMEMENSGIFYLLKNEKIKKLAFVYQLFSRTEDCLHIMAEYVSKYLRNLGINMIEEGRRNIHILEFIHSWIDLVEKFNVFLCKSFKSDKYIQKMIVNDFEHLLNLDPKYSEYLSLFINDKLKKKAKDFTGEIEEGIIDKSFILFRYLRDKDLFLKYYIQHMAKRLLFNRRISNDSEQEVILKLKMECGSQYTFKLEKMIKDVIISDETIEDFNNNTQFSGHFPRKMIELNVKVLTSQLWPIQKCVVNCCLPEYPRKIFDAFMKFYLKRHCGRKLILQPQFGWADISAEFCGETLQENSVNGDCTKLVSNNSLISGNPRNYILQVSTYQMCILMLFNSEKSVSFEDMLLETDIPEKDLKRSLETLVSGKPWQRILLKHPEGTPFRSSDTFVVNEAFSSRFYRVKVQPYKNRDSTGSGKIIEDNINEDRKYAVEAAIVKTMKASKVLHHKDLISNVILLLKHRFQPGILLIKTRIESLIEREYLARKDDDKEIYLYIQQ
ncbi:cullin-3-B-like [Centruroides vittatus]|uniref:cullin-3-B-like n=1 Tax=Centruroides vittatus TaxID=120091 RepID=UPI00350FE423